MAATRGAFATAPAAATSAQRTLLLLPPAAAAAPHQAHPAAAWGAAAPHGLPQHRAHRALLPPCRITNTSEEVYRAVGKKVPDGGIPDEIMMPEIQVHNPELGVLENRVGKFYLQELFEDSGVDLEETAYWFHTPPGGWDAKPVKMVPAPDAPVTFPEPHHAEDEEDSANRVPISQLEEGVEVVGMVTDCWLYHGIQVDFGAEYDGLVPIREECWREEGVRETLLPGAEVRVRIYKLRTPGLYRWPVQLELVDPSWINNMLPPPEAYQAPINHEWCDEQGWTVEQICEATGRGFAPNSLLMPLDHAVQMQDIEKMYAWDDPDTNLYFRSPIQDYLEEEGGEEITELVTRMQVEGF